MPNTRTNIERVLEHAIKVSDLIDLLKDCDPEARVLFACNYGDYHNTQQALPVDSPEEMDSDELYETAYSHSGIALAEHEEDRYDGDEDDDDDCDWDSVPIVVLR